MHTTLQPQHRARHTLSVQVYPELRDRIRERAEREERSLGQIMRRAVEAYLADEQTEQRS